ncbi:hypothetical protein BB561_000870 [Smittium simulii]|uniref:Galactose-1-phosphate uridylyltransferase n=1 Tax=Smittium simulii TaxID=133385 RepID=A0A2T9YX54_9FUNG|nr:hypothetical protein BB561_000870 [Smittium simulii]
MEEFSVDEHPHKRFNILTNGWVLVSPHRAKRPWLGQTSDKQDNRGPPLDIEGNPLTVDPGCYLCPNNSRAGATVQQNPDYKSVYIFDNDFPAVLTDQPEYKTADLFALVDDNDLTNSLFSISPVRGKCRVICYSPNHYETFADLSTPQIKSVIYNWMKIYYDFSIPPPHLISPGIVNYVQIFENKGAEMGCSNPHPHGQVWALEKVSEQVENEIANMKAYSSKHLLDIPSSKSSAENKLQRLNEDGASMRCMLCDYVKIELKTAHNDKIKSNRVVFENESFVALVPFWATWPFETLVLPKLHITNICQLLNPSKKPNGDSNACFNDYIKLSETNSNNLVSVKEIGEILSQFSDINSEEVLKLSDTSPLQTQLVEDFSSILSKLTKTYDNLFETSFPYSMGIHQDPVLNHADSGYCHLHLHFYPPLLRNSKIKKFFVGYEMLGEPQRDLSPEMAAQRLRDAIPKDIRD